MGEYCFACSQEIFGRDSLDFKGITPEVDFRKGKACTVLCEGCGKIQVDPSGKCLSAGCFKSGHPGHDCSWVAPEASRGVFSRIGSLLLKLLK